MLIILIELNLMQREEFWTDNEDNKSMHSLDRNSIACGQKQTSVKNKHLLEFTCSSHLNFELS